MIALGNYGFSLAGTTDVVFSSTAFNTMFLLFVSVLGWMLSTPSVGLTRIATTDSIGGALARRLLLPSLLLPIAFIFMLKPMLTIFDLSESLVVSLASMFTGVTVAYLVWWVANLIDKNEFQLRESNELRDNANTDALTNIANRRAFDEKLAQMLHRRREQDEVFSLLLLDLDNFKDYNDTYGHLAGDNVLRITGSLLRAALRPSDLPARYGGEEFAFLLGGGTNAAHAHRVAERIIDDFHSYTWPHKPVTTSIGIAEARLEDSAEELIRRADEALYRAKHEGRDQAV
jgi:diguanylate cyclase (GGDEF)-like protein